MPCIAELFHAAATAAGCRPTQQQVNVANVVAPFGRGEKSTNFVGAGYPLNGFRHKISDAEYEIESPSKQEKAIVREMRDRYKRASRL